MDLSNIGYYIKSGLNDLRRNSAMTVSSVIIVIAGICILGIYSLISTNINYISTQLCGQYSLTAYLEKGTPSDRVEAMTDEVKGIDGVASVEYISEEQALESCKEMFGDDSGFLDGLEEDNPLRGSLLINLDDISKGDEVAAKTEEVTDVAWVKNDSELADRLTESTAFMRRISFILFAVFLVIAVFIIANTIRMTIIARQEDIRTMRYLGAANRFIAMPFVAEGILIGIAGAAAAYMLTMLGYAYLYAKLTPFLGDMIRIYSPGAVTFRILIQYLLAGIFLGGGSSVFPLVKYVKV